MINPFGNEEVLDPSGSHKFDSICGSLVNIFWNESSRAALEEGKKSQFNTMSGKPDIAPDKGHFPERKRRPL